MHVLQLLAVALQVSTAPLRTSATDVQYPLQISGVMCSHTQYNSYEETNKCLESIVASYPEHAELVNIGQSYEERNTHGIHIWGSQKGRDAAFVTAGMGAREWIGPAVAQYLAKSLLEYRQPDVLEQVDFYIFPLTNPDGYEYSRQHDRTWKKTRGITGGSGCRGADMQRNFALHFGGSGSSSNPCSNTFKGSAAESEVEVANLVKFYHSLTKTVRFYINFGAYGQLLLRPLACCSTKAPGEDDVVQDALALWANATKDSYDIGVFAEVLYEVGGHPMDYFHAAGSKFSVDVMLPDEGADGFLLPSSKIEQVANGTMAGLQSFVLKLALG